MHNFYVWKSVDCYFLYKLYRDIVRFFQEHKNSRFSKGWTVLTETIVLAADEKTVLDY